MIYLSGNNSVSNNNYSGGQQFISQPKAVINKNNPMETDSVSFSSNTEKPKDKNKLMTYILGGLAVVVGGIILAVNLKKGKKVSSDIGKDIKKGVEDLGKKDTNLTGKSKKTSGHSNSSARSETSSSDTGNINGSTIQQKTATIAQQKENIAQQEGQIAELEKKSTELDKQIKKIDDESLPVTTSPPSAKPLANEEIIEPLQGKSADEMLENAFDMYAEELSKTPRLKAKKELIREILPDLQGFFKSNSGIINGINNEREILEVFTHDNKDFLLKQVLPHFAGNLDKYGISNSFDLASLLKIVTPKNKDFMFNEVLPTILNHSQKLDISGSEIAELAEEITPSNLKNIKIIADNLDNFDIKDSMDCLDLDKFKVLLRKDSSELLKI